MQILLIGHETEATRFLVARLREAEFRCRIAASADLACRRHLIEHAEAIILDVSGASSEACQTVRRLRGAGIVQPLLVLTPQCDWRIRIECLDAGADDHVVKPVRTEEIVARIRAIVRRRAGSSTDHIACGELELDLKAKCAWLAGKCLDLTRNEFRLLRLFVLRPHNTMTHQEIWSQLNDDGAKCSNNAVEVQVARLRRKVGHDRIRTVRGVGYRYAPFTAVEGPPGPDRFDVEETDSWLDADEQEQVRG